VWKSTSGGSSRWILTTRNDGLPCAAARVNTLAVLGMAFGASEVGLSIWKRSRTEAQRADAGSLRIIWVVILTGWALAVSAAYFAPSACFRLGTGAYVTAFALVAAGVVLRWYSIWYLGRFFTVDVAIAAGHRLIDTGPYRRIRHPSYSGALLAFLGLSLLFHNALSMVVLLVPISLAFLHRIRIEERALRTGLGDPYVEYSRRTKMLIPGVF
jgi:protein-S-isoprenylcysteine O-methyltransferase